MPSDRQIRGGDAETRAEALLTEHGYRIVARNWRGANHEIDRVAWDGEVLVFIEIRSRTDVQAGHPLETVRSQKQRHVVRGALAYLATLAELPVVRFDVVSVVYRGDRTDLELVRDAFEVELRPRGPVPFL